MLLCVLLWIQVGSLFLTGQSGAGSKQPVPAANKRKRSRAEGPRAGLSSEETRAGLSSEETRVNKTKRGRAERPKAGFSSEDPGDEDSSGSAPRRKRMRKMSGDAVG